MGDFPGLGASGVPGVTELPPGPGDMGCPFRRASRVLGVQGDGCTSETRAKSSSKTQHWAGWAGKTLVVPLEAPCSSESKTWT